MQGSGNRAETARSRWPVGKLLGVLREGLFLVFVTQRGQPGCRRDRQFADIDERDELSTALAEDLRGVGYRSGRDVDQGPGLVPSLSELTWWQICHHVGSRAAPLGGILFHPLGGPGRDHRPLGLVEVAAVQVETEGYLGERPLALPLHKAGLDSSPITGAVAVAAVDDEAVGVEQDRLRKAILFDVGGELTEGLAGEQRKQVRQSLCLTSR